MQDQTLQITSFSLQGFEKLAEIYSFLIPMSAYNLLVAVAIELYSMALFPPADLSADILRTVLLLRLTFGRRVGDGCDCAALWWPLCLASC